MKKVLALVLALIMLSSVAVTTTSAYVEEVNWEEVTNSIGMNLYIGDETTTPPTIDGVVNEGEYPYSVYNAPEDIYYYYYEQGEIQSGVTEYFAHDDFFIYYAAEFTQTAANKAFQWQFKPHNSFAIYNDKTVPKMHKWRIDMSCKIIQISI